jgi:hypothetical protein
MRPVTAPVGVQSFFSDARGRTIGITSAQQVDSESEPESDTQPMPPENPDVTPSTYPKATDTEWSFVLEYAARPESWSKAWDMMVGVQPGAHSSPIKLMAASRFREEAGF